MDIGPVSFGDDSDFVCLESAWSRCPKRREITSAIQTQGNPKSIIFPGISKGVLPGVVVMSRMYFYGLKAHSPHQTPVIRKYNLALSLKRGRPAVKPCDRQVSNDPQIMPFIEENFRTD